MNYLIHFFLAGDDAELRLGNLLGDFVKGRVERFQHPGLTDRLRLGIQMHRTIDAFSDRHPAVHRSKRILSAQYGRLSGVIVDVFYDHVLARRWTEHHPRPLEDYTQEIYRTLKENLLWVRHFETIEELRQALLEFRETYNTKWLIDRHGYLTPAGFRQKQLQSAAEAA